MANTPKNSVKSRLFVILATDGVNGDQLNVTKKALVKAGAQTKIVAIKVDFTFLTSASVLFDAVYIPGGMASVNTLQAEVDAVHFVTEAFKHCKAIAAEAEGTDMLKVAQIPFDTKGSTPPGILADQQPAAFISAIANHRFWEREKNPDLPA